MNVKTLNMVYFDDNKVIVKQKGNGGSGGGGSANPTGIVNDVTFYDYDGAVLYGFSKAEFLALGAMPALPKHEGLICQGWNWAIADAQTYVELYGCLNVGATYITDDGATRLHIVIPVEGRQTFPLYFEQSVANGVTIDWGDGSDTQTITGTGVVSAKHTYNSIGNFTIRLMPSDDCILRLGDNNQRNLIDTASSGFSMVYFSMLKRVHIGKNVNSIGNRTFYYCHALEGITIPQGVTEIGQYVFSYCASLKSITLPNGTTIIKEETFGTCYSLANISLPNTLTDILNYEFSNCKSLASITIPNITVINPSTFSSCQSLTKVIIPSSVSTIQTFAFSTCNGVKTYDFSHQESVPTLAGTNAFNGMSSDCVIVIPDALFDSWKTATNWSTYASKMVKASEYTQ